MKMVSVVRFQEVRKTFLASTLVRSHSRIFWRDSCRGVWSPLAQFFDMECKRVLVTFVPLICLCWWFNACNHVVYRHVIRYLINDGIPVFVIWFLKWTGYHTEWEISVLEHCFQAWAWKDLLTRGALLHLDHKLNKASYTSATWATLRSPTSKEGHIDPQIW